MNDNQIQILQPPQCGIITPNGMVTAKNSHAVINIMEKNYELEHRGSGIFILILLLIWGGSLYAIYKFFKMMLEIEKIGKEDMKDDE